MPNPSTSPARLALHWRFALRVATIAPGAAALILAGCSSDGKDAKTAPTYLPVPHPTSTTVPVDPKVINFDPAVRDLPLNPGIPLADYAGLGEGGFVFGKYGHLNVDPVYDTPDNKPAPGAKVTLNLAYWSDSKNLTAFDYPHNVAEMTLSSSKAGFSDIHRTQTLGAIADADVSSEEILAIDEYELPDNFEGVPWINVQISAPDGGELENLTFGFIATARNGVIETAIKTGFCPPDLSDKGEPFRSFRAPNATDPNGPTTTTPAKLDGISCEL